MTTIPLNPQTASGWRAKGNHGERVIKLRLQSLGHEVLDGKMAEKAVDLIVLCCQIVVEVKTPDWNALPSRKRRLCALAGDEYRAKGYRHLTICKALTQAPLVLEAGIRGGQARMLHKAPEWLTDACGTPHRTPIEVGAGPHGPLMAGRAPPSTPDLPPDLIYPNDDRDGPDEEI